METPDPFQGGADSCVQISYGLRGGVPHYYQCALKYGRLVLIDKGGDKEFAPAGIYYKKAENKIFHVGVGGFPLDKLLR